MKTKNLKKETKETQINIKKLEKEVINNDN